MMAFLLAFTIVATPVQSPTINWDALSLDNQMALIDVWRPDPPPATLPVQYVYHQPVTWPPIEWSGEIEQWRPLVSRYFPPAWVDWAMAIIFCESNGDPNATNSSSGAAGLFQHMPQFWEARSQAAGWGGQYVYNPEANVAVAAWLLGNGSGVSHWVCKAPLP